MITTIASLQQLATEKGGQCLDIEITYPIQKLNWKCGEGHQWKMTAHAAHQGEWCPDCKRLEKRKAKLAIKLKQIKEIALSKGGLCLNESYRDSFDKLSFQCKNGHKWSAYLYPIVDGKWCKFCAKEDKRLSFEQMQEIAKKHGGKCLSEKYEPNASRIHWECSEGHTWYMRPSELEKDGWCPFCKTIEKKKLQWESKLKQISEIALSKGGHCLNESYQGCLERLSFQCKEGHTWDALPASIVNGSWCPLCSFIKKSSTLAYMQETAKKLGGECLSKEYINCHYKLEWKCSEGHTWSTLPGTILNNKSWCPKCEQLAQAKKFTTPFEVVETIVKNKGGKIVSGNYITLQSRLKFQCANGHLWETKAEVIKKGHWCIKCFHENATRTHLVQDTEGS